MHLTSELALDLIEGRSAGDEMKELTEHIGTCSSCSRKVDEWRQMLALLRRSHLESAPAEFLENARAILDAKPELKRQKIREITAVIVFDSFMQPALSGTRGAAESRQVGLRAREFDIHLKISTNPSQRQMIGQVFARNETQFLGSVCVHLLQNGKRFKSTWSDNFGEFQFDDVPPGEFWLQVELPHLTIGGGITIGERST